MSREFDRYRAGAHKRGYDHRWEAESAAFKNRHPLCEGCLAIGVSRASEVVDHIVPHRGNARLFWERNNWQACCKWHHDAIKPILEREHRAGRITAAELVLSSSTAQKLSRAKHKPAIGADGFAIPGT